MNDLSRFVKKHGESERVRFLCLIWLMMENIHYNPKNSKESARTTLSALHWFSEGLYPLTWTELHTLYSLLRHTGTTNKTSVSATEISTLLSRLCAINSEKFSGTSLFQNFKDVEPFISTLYSGTYPEVVLNPSDIPDWLQECGNTDSST